MSKRDEALAIIRAVGLPRAQQNECSALTLLALADVRPKGSWRKTQQPLLRILDIMGFMRKYYRKDYAANSRETVRRRTIHQFEQARIVDRNPDDPSRPTNSGNTCYALTDAVVPVLRSYGADAFDAEVERFIGQFGRLREAYRRSRRSKEVRLRLPNGSEVHLSPGKHNQLQVAVIEEFGPRFAPGATVLYVGGTARKHVVCETDALASLKIEITRHDKLPDVLLHDSEKNWLFVIEAATAHGPVDAKRHTEIEHMLRRCTAARIYVTAFLNRNDFRKYAADVAWETEVWIADTPEHMIHFNGPKFLGPYAPRNA
ncbi:MAG TPA: BsuBI/PstI family type II restriction endonuclease [Thermoguttaceae bacterium]|nr:BsuBI/PstI family type II restriction endonuclease [Thermoguttaceae bacterium]